MKKAALLFFLAAAAGEIIGLLIGSTSIQFICKSLIMVALGLYYYTHATTRSITVWLAITFCLVGDIMFMFEHCNNHLFVAALSAFLIAHVCYISSYRQHQSNAEKNPLTGIQKVRFAFPIVLAGTGLIVILYPSLESLRIPVFLYALVLVTMVINAVLRYGRTTTQSFGFVLTGSILFMISDSLLAINKFLSTFPSASLSIMGTYILAQFLVISGLCKHESLDNISTTQ